MARKIKVDPNICIGCGSCTAIAPNSFIMTDEGKAEPKNPAGDSEKTIQEAIDSCPVAAITWGNKKDIKILRY